MDALVTHGWSRISYNVVRSLGRRGLDVAVGVDRHCGMARFSKYARKTFRHPSFGHDPDGFVASVEDAIRRFRPRVYLPSEEEIFVVARHRKRFEELGTRVPVDTSETLELLNDKSRILQRGSELGIPIPKTELPTSFEDIVRFGQSVGYPIVLKIQGTTGGHGVYYLQEQELADNLAKIVRRHAVDFGQFLVQQFVRGTGWGVSLLCREGEVLRTFAHRRVREKSHTGGPSTVRISARNPQLEEYSSRLATAVNFSGVAMVEFKEDADGEACWLLEVNPRFWGSVGLAMSAGVDFPYLLFQLALGEKLPAAAEYRTDVTAKWLLGDFYARWEHRRAGLSVRRWGETAVDVFDDLYWDDPLPFLAQVFLYGRKQLFARK